MLVGAHLMLVTFIMILDQTELKFIAMTIFQCRYCTQEVRIFSVLIEHISYHVLPLSQLRQFRLLSANMVLSKIWWLFVLNILLLTPRLSCMINNKKAVFLNTIGASCADLTVVNVKQKNMEFVIETEIVLALVQVRCGLVISKIQNRHSIWNWLA